MGESKILLHVDFQIVNNCRMDRTNLRQLQGKLDDKSAYRAHVSQRLPYDTLHLDDVSISSIYFELM
jgi:hypothetical protein